MRAYWFEIFRRGWAETRTVLRIDSKGGIALAVILTIASILALLFLVSKEAAWDEFISKVAALVVLIGAMLPLVFFWKPGARQTKADTN